MVPSMSYLKIKDYRRQNNETALSGDICIHCIILCGKIFNYTTLIKDVLFKKSVWFSICKL